ncbi:MAG: signal peptidase II [Rhizobiaceae bacterium]
MKATNYRTVAFYLIALLVAVGIDQWIKFWVETNLPLQVPEPFLPYISLYRTYNTGIAFSLLRSVGDTGLIVVSLLIIGFVSYLALRSAPGLGLARFGFVLIIGGALGNLVDRIVYGHVIDYVMFHTDNWSFAIFNLADAFISVGAALVVIEELIVWWRGPRAGEAG